jgi:hypothetical protein
MSAHTCVCVWGGEIWALEAGWRVVCVCGGGVDDGVGGSWVFVEGGLVGTQADEGGWHKGQEVLGRRASGATAAN